MTLLRTRTISLGARLGKDGWEGKEGYQQKDLHAQGWQAGEHRMGG